MNIFTLKKVIKSPNLFRVSDSELSSKQWMNGYNSTLAFWYATFGYVMNYISSCSFTIHFDRTILNIFALLVLVLDLHTLVKTVPLQILFHLGKLKRKKESNLNANKLINTRCLLLHLVSLENTNKFNQRTQDHNIKRN